MAKQAAHLDGGTFLDGKTGDRARHGGVHFDRDLVGFQLAQWLVDRDLIACFHQPLGNGRLGDRFTQCRNLDHDGHD